MIEENAGKKDQQNTSENPKFVTPAPTIPAPVQTTNPVPATQQTSGQSTANSGANEVEETIPRTEKNMSRFERFILRATWAGVIAAAITGAIIYSQFRAMTDQNQILSAQSISAVAGAIESERITREQLKIAREQAVAAENNVEAIQNQMRLDQRAWVTVDVGEKGGNFSVSMHNTGRTPALNVTYTVGFTPGKLGVIPDVEADLRKSNSSTSLPLPKNLPADVLDRLKKEGVIREHPPTGFVIAPDKSEIASYYGAKFSQVIGSDAQRIYIQGRIGYDDVFGRKHETFFCYWYAAPNAYPMCNEHNKMN